MATGKNSGMDQHTREAFERLLVIAQDDTGSSRLCADFILAWWNAEGLRGFNLVYLASIHKHIAADMLAVLRFLVEDCQMAAYPYEYRSQIEELIHRWRPEVV